MDQHKRRILLNPGPVTLTDSVRQNIVALLESAADRSSVLAMRKIRPASSPWPEYTVMGDLRDEDFDRLFTVLRSL